MTDNIRTFDTIPSAGPLKIKIRIENKSSKILLQPEGRCLEFKYENGCGQLQLNTLEIHDIIVLK